MNKKHSFIPKSHRPYVPGGRLKDVKTVPGHGCFPTCEFAAHILVISSLDDIIPGEFLKSVSFKKNQVYRLFYEHLGIDWDFQFTGGELVFHTKDGVLSPKAIYHRHPGISEEHPQIHKHRAFFEVIDLWEGNLLGQKRDHYHNSSKMYQSITSLSVAIAKSKAPELDVPKSFFVKGTFERIKKKDPAKFIVKSCSSIRSEVVSGEEFETWNQSGLNCLPTLFQEKIDGDNLRVHLCRDELWALLIQTSSGLDYRYSGKENIKYSSFDLPNSLKEFCKNVASIEKNRLIGVDFILSNGKFYCLESNPGPGWSTFNHATKVKFAEKVLKELLNAKKERKKCEIH